MFKSFLKITFRNLFKNKAYTLINLSGLAIGMSCIILVLLWVENEFSYDRFFKNADNIHLVLQGIDKSYSTSTSELMAPELKEKFPEITDVTDYGYVNEDFLFKYKGKTFNEHAAFTDNKFFNIFNFPFVEGNRETALSTPNSLVVTESFAKKYFGEKKAVGKIVTFDLVNTKYNLRVTGIIKDLPQNTHFQRQAFVSMSLLNKRFPNMLSWGSFWPRTYVVLKPNTSVKSLEQKITNTFKVYFPQSQQSALNFKLQDLKDIHLFSSGIHDLAIHGDITDVYIVIVIALLILIIACANYINLSTAMSFKRSKEVGIKKVIGAGRLQLINSFIWETFIFVFISMGIAIVLAELFMPFMNNLTGKNLSLNWSNLNLVGGLFLIMILTGIISAYYPALFLSSYNPVRIFKGETFKGNKSLSVRKGLIVFQFSLLIGLIICTLVVTKQLSFVENGKLGYNKENILCVPLNGFSYTQIDALKSELSNDPSVVSSCASEPVDDRSLSSTTSFFWKGKTRETNQAITRLHADQDLASTYKLTLKEGRFFLPEFSASDSNNFVLNETAAKLMGKTSPIGKEFKLGNRVGKIIGVVKDFHFSSFHKKIDPLVIVKPNEKQNARLRILSIRLKPGNLKNSVSSVEKIWKDVSSSAPFNFYFLDQYIDAQYRAEQRTETLLSYFSIFAILIACLGLYGLTLFMTEAKTKEIGVRKVLGASVKSIVSLFIKDFTKWILIANIIAWPLAYYFMNRWLQTFAYKIELSWWLFALSAGIALVIALITIGFQAIKAATANPVKSLRYE